jgi:molybdenum cofactor biosynthesis enzyme MoaA
MGNINEDIIEEEFEDEEIPKLVKRIEDNQEEMYLIEDVSEGELEQEKVENDEEFNFEMEIEREILLFEELILDFEIKDEETNAILRSGKTT